jgi:hypothetical protein
MNLGKTSLCSILVGFLTTGYAWADETPGGFAPPATRGSAPVRAAPAAAPLTAPRAPVAAAPIAGRPLKSTLTLIPALLNPDAASLCNSVPAAAARIKERYLAANQAVKPFSCGHPSVIDNSGNISSLSSHTKSVCCSPQTTYSVEQQQAAGCKGSDTVSACMSKLTTHCVEQLIYSSTSKAGIQKRRDNLIKASAALRRLEHELEQLQLIVPK